MADLLYSILPKPPRELVSIKPDRSVEDCCHLMNKQNIGAVLVYDNKNLLGIVSERDIIRQCLCQGRDPAKVLVSEITYPNVSFLQANDTVEMAMETMTKTKRRHILVKDGEQILAIVSIGDLLYHMLDEKSRVIAHLENYINS